MKYSKGKVISDYGELLEQKIVCYKSISIRRFIFRRWPYDFAAKCIEKGILRLALPQKRILGGENGNSK